MSAEVPMTVVRDVIFNTYRDHKQRFIDERDRIDSFSVGCYSGIVNELNALIKAFGWEEIYEKRYKEGLGWPLDDTSEEYRDDPVNHPSHYTGKYECFDVLRSIYGDNAVKDFCLCNTFKYLWRHKRKNGIEDLRKARWYLDKLIEMEEHADESMECHCNGDQNKACDGHCSDMGKR